ncbi:MAG: HD domain-containing protein, partial [Nanoarchaeota archaeon]|nr:HD domain-containing protein [Nanoarchaeota archaeon]
IAARLHDIDYSRGPKYHTQDSAKYAFKLLTKMGYPTNKIKQVEETILCHTSSIVKTMNNPSKEGEILFDADKMWTMTPKGFARTIAHRYQNNKSYSFIIQQLQKSIGKFDELFFDLSRELIRKDRDICIKFMDNLIDI